MASKTQTQLATHQAVRPPAVVWQLAVVFGAALLVRVGLMLLFQTWQFGDVRDHYEFGFETGSIAASLARGWGYSSPFGGGVSMGPTAWVAPLYPAMVALVFKICGVYSATSALVVLTINSVFSALTCLTIYGIGDVVFGRKVGLCSAWTWAVVPFFARWPITWVWETALAALLLSWLFLMTLKLESTKLSGWLKLGAVWGIAALASPSILSFLPLSFSYPAWRLRHQMRRVALPLICAGLLAAVIVSPWLLRNYRVFGQPVFLRSNYWFEFSLGNFHGAGGAAWSGAHPAMNPAYLQHYADVGELKFIAERKAKAFQFVRENRAEFVWITLKRITSFWDGSELNYEPPDPFKPRMMLTATVLAGGGLWLALRRRVRHAMLFAGLFALYPVPYYLTYINMRYRHPIEPMMVVLTGYLLVEGWKWAAHLRSGGD